MITGWLPYFHKLPLLSRQEEDGWAKSFLSWDFGFLFRKGAGTGEHASSPEVTSHWSKLTGFSWLEGGAFSCPASEQRGLCTCCSLSSHPAQLPRFYPVFAQMSASYEAFSTTLLTISFLTHPLSSTSTPALIYFSHSPITF